MVAATIASVGAAAGFHAVIEPPSPAKMNRAGPLPSELLTTKPVVVFETWPDGGPAGMLTTSGTIAFGVTGGAPEMSVAVLVPALEIHSGLVGRNESPHGFTTCGSVSVARPAMSETTFD